MIYIGIILLFVTVIAVIVAMFSDYWEGPAVVGAIALVLAVIAVVIANFTTVDAGEVVVPVRFGEVQDVIAVEGIHRISPFADRVTMPIRTVEVTFSDSENDEDGLDAITSLSAEGATVTVDLTLLYHIDPARAGDVYRTVGTAWETTLVLPITRSSTRDCLPQFEFERARTSDRALAADCILESVQQQLAVRGIVVEDVLLRDMRADTQLQAAIDAKLQAQNEVKEAEFRRQRAEVEAETAVVDARGRAQATIIAAEAEAQANRVIADSLSENVLALRVVEALGDNAFVYAIPQGVVPTVPLPTP